MIINDALYKAFLGIMIANFNANGKVDDAQVCAAIAQHIHNSGIEQYSHTLWEFIAEHGEDVDMDYMGRDADGEKVYHTYNPQTNWHERIRKELVALGHFKQLVTV